MIKVIIFDFDGVLVESVDLKTEAFAKLFEPEGKNVSDAVVSYHLKNTGVSRYDKFRYIYKNILKRTLAEERFKELCDKFSDLVMDGVVNAPYVKGAKEFLEKNSSACKIFVTSATPKDEIEEIVRRRGMGRFFNAVYGAPLKKSDAVSMIMKNTGALPHEAVYVGDALSDYEAAKANSIFFVCRQNNNEELFKAIKCPKIKDLLKLQETIIGYDNSITG